MLTTNQCAEENPKVRPHPKKTHQQTKKRKSRKLPNNQGNQLNKIRITERGELWKKTKEINEQKERSWQLESIIDTLRRDANDKENHQSTMGNLNEEMKIKDCEINKLKETNTSDN